MHELKCRNSLVVFVISVAYLWQWQVFDPEYLNAHT